MVPPVGGMSVTTQRSWGCVLGLMAAADPNTLQEQDLEAGAGSVIPRSLYKRAALRSAGLRSAGQRRELSSWVCIIYKSNNAASTQRRAG